MKIIGDRLHIEKLEKKFRNYKKISVEDFYEFYNDVFGDIKKNTVSGYIYELKNKKIIRTISRGQYVLENVSRDEVKEYIVITMDIIKSSKLDYQEFDRLLFSKIDSINSVIRRRYDSDRTYNISQGDEIQILFPFDENIGNLIMLTLSNLYPFEARYGISVGEFNDELKKNSWEMNGPLFWNARDQLEKLKSSNTYNGLVISGYNQTDRLCNNLLPLINKTVSRITDKQWEALRYELQKTELNQSLNEIKISKTSYYDRLSGSNVEAILQSYKVVYDLMKMRRDIN